MGKRDMFLKVIKSHNFKKGELERVLAVALTNTDVLPDQNVADFLKGCKEHFRKAGESK